MGLLTLLIILPVAMQKLHYGDHFFGVGVVMTLAELETRKNATYVGHVSHMICIEIFVLICPQLAPTAKAEGKRENAIFFGKMHFRETFERARDEKKLIMIHNAF